MAIKIHDGKYKCSFCNKIYHSPFEADICRDSHDAIYVQILKSDLDRLVKFIMTKDDNLITETLMNTLRKYLYK